MRPFSTPKHESAGAWLSCDLVFVSCFHSRCTTSVKTNRSVFYRFAVHAVCMHREVLDEYVCRLETIPKSSQHSVGGSLLGSPASVSVSPHKAARSARQTALGVGRHGRQADRQVCLTRPHVYVSLYIVDRVHAQARSMSRRNMSKRLETGI